MARSGNPHGSRASPTRERRIVLNATFHATFGESRRSMPKNLSLATCAAGETASLVSALLPLGIGAYHAASPAPLASSS